MTNAMAVLSTKNKVTISRNREIDKQVYEYLLTVNQTTKFMLRQKFILSGEGTLKRSISSLKHKQIISVEGDKIKLLRTDVIII